MTYETILTEANKAYDCCLNNNSIMAREFLRKIQELCGSEIRLSQAKSKGGSELKRKKAADAIIKNIPDIHEYMRGYINVGEDFICPNGNEIHNGIVLTDGYVMYIGTPITGIEPVVNSSTYLDWRSCVEGILKHHNNTHLKNTESIDIAVLKSNLKIAKAEAKAEGIKKEDIPFRIKEACLITHDSEGKKNAVFNADYIVKACEMLGGNKWNITTSTAVQGGIIEGENGMCVVMPLRKPEWLEE